MHTIDRSNSGKYLLDPARIIPEAHLQSVCKIYQGAKTCRYIALTVNGFACVKNCPLKDKQDLLVDMAKQGHVKYTARGNNCEGLYGKTVEESIQEKGISKKDHTS